MSRLRRHRLGPALTAGLFLGGFVLVGGVQAIPPARTLSPYAQQAAVLHATVVLLHKADHDYEGHRVKAIEHIHAAIHVLAPGAHKHKPHAKQTGGGNEAQDVSDAQLKQAKQQVQTIMTTLSGDQSAAATKAAAHLQLAMEELDTALKIR